ncbi:glutathione S-transferase family protein [Sphingobium tyrosinilyticum]|uniref:Glutathione S-transferase family protein n=2 Tax=Sphingobium TaxID=165695 RepID=A0ABV9F2C9_9SPHN
MIKDSTASRGRAAMSELTIWTLDWVPEGPRGFVRDLRLRWACEEADLPYAIRTVRFDDRETNHLDRQPFGQVPFLDVGGLKMFESGAALLHLARSSDVLMPSDPAGEAETLQWTIAALNSVEMASVPWWFLTLSGDENNQMTGWLGQRLDHMERVLSETEWLAAGRFTVADLLMADVLRIPKVRAFGDRPATEAYVSRVTARPAFKKAYDDQICFFKAADEKRAEKA